MTSYRFFKMAAIESEIYFRVRCWWWHSFGKMEIPNFDKISQSTAEIKLLSVSENGRPPFWNSISGFYFGLIFVIGVSFCTGLPNFVKIELILAELWRHIDFLRWRPAAILDLIWIILDHPRRRFLYFAVWLEIAYSRPLLGGELGTYFFQMTSPTVLTPKDTFYAETRRLRHNTWQSVQRFDLGTFPRKKGTGQDRTVKKVTKW